MTAENQLDPGWLLTLALKPNPIHDRDKDAKNFTPMAVQGEKSVGKTTCGSQRGYREHVGDVGPWPIINH